MPGCPSPLATDTPRLGDRTLLVSLRGPDTPRLAAGTGVLSAPTVPLPGAEGGGELAGFLAPSFPPGITAVWALAPGVR